MFEFAIVLFFAGAIMGVMGIFAQWDAINKKKVLEIRVDDGCGAWGEWMEVKAHHVEFVYENAFQDFVRFMEDPNYKNSRKFELR